MANILETDLNISKKLVKLIQDTGVREHRPPREIFRDFVAMSALSIANDREYDQKREDEYLRIVKKYNPDTIRNTLVEFLSELFRFFCNGKFSDILGDVFHKLEVHNGNIGQFFTPYEVSKLMAQMTFSPNDIRTFVEDHGWVSVHEPACGSGSSLIAFAEVMTKHGFSPRTMNITAVDIDSSCVHMTFIQLAMIGCHGTVIHGNTLTMEEWDHWKL